MARPTNDSDPSRNSGSIWEDIRLALGVKTAEDRIVATGVFLGAVLLVLWAVDAITTRFGLPDVVNLALMVASGPLAATISVAVVLLLFRRSH